MYENSVRGGLRRYFEVLHPIHAKDLWALEYTTDGNGQVNFHFIAPCNRIELAQQADVAFIDATYRTNRYNMPPIHFMVVTSYRKTVRVMCFVASEEEAMYSRAVKAFKTLVMGDAKMPEKEERLEG
jgi:MULE transposase domain